MLSKKMQGAVLLSGSVIAAMAWSHGEQGHDPIGEPAIKTTRTVAIRMSDTMQYIPNMIQIKRGEAITLAFKNEGKLKHEAILGALPELQKHAEMMKMHPDMTHDDPKSISAQAGETALIKWKFTQAGTFYIGCLMPGHFDAGMRATLIVK